MTVPKTTGTKINTSNVQKLIDEAQAILVDQEQKSTAPPPLNSIFASHKSATNHFLTAFPSLAGLEKKPLPAVSPSLLSQKMERLRAVSLDKIVKDSEAPTGKQSPPSALADNLFQIFR